MSKLRGADLIARTLAVAGVERLFTLSGNQVMPVFDACIDEPIELIHVRHEAAAVHMADAWGRLTGQPGVALLTAGSGHANGLSALYVAMAAESPLVVLTGHCPQAETERGAFQEMAQAEMAGHVAKASWTAGHAERLGHELARAFRTATGGRPGPVHLSLPVDLLEAELDESAELLPQPDDCRPMIGLLDVQTAEEVLSALGRAERPLILAGPAVMRCDSDTGGGEPDASGSPGEADASGSPPHSNEATASDAEAGAQSDWFQHVRDAVRFRPPQWDDLSSSTENKLHPVEVCRAVNAFLAEDDEAVFVSDGGEFGQWAQGCIAAPHRLINGPAGAIGSSIPFALAARIAFPRSRIVSLLGDGTFGFHAMEFDTAVRYQLPFIAVVGNDACWNAERQIQIARYGEHRQIACDLLPTRYDQVVRALGGHGEHVTAPGQMMPALRRALASGKPACINVALESHAAPIVRLR